MADEHYKWLNRKTAERLLSGESLEAVDPSASDQAERLSRTLGALSAEAAPGPAELPGEQAALAAFRKAREAAEAERRAVAFADGAPGRRSGGPSHRADAGLVHIAKPAGTGIAARRPRWARPARLVLAAAVAAGTLGGVAVAAGSGVLPTPFRDEPPGPAVSTTAGTSGQPLAPASRQATPGTAPGTPSGSPGATRGDASDEAAGPDDGTGPGHAPGSDAPSATPGTGWNGAAAACRDIRDGKELDTGRRRALETLAGGSARVNKYCKVVLAAGGPVPGTANGGSGGNGGSGDANGGSAGDDAGNDKGGGTDDGKDKGGEKGDGQGDDDSHPRKGGGRGGSGGKGRHRRGAAPAPSTLAPAHPGQAPTTPSPSPTYTAL
ncbi:hypothetical protein ABZ079_01750 [Streptomyces sp. NPDC006314]|uniref:hypothetical protein n=1 Tax=Streptomyces sp. NPDC006314 TaxID=3154475 RepID=UPI0033B0CABE